MGMSIDDAMNHIKYGIIENNYPLQRDFGIEACNVALDTMHKYQKIKQIIDDWENSGEEDDPINIIDNIEEVLEDGKHF